MPVPELCEALADHSDVHLRTEEPMHRHTPLRVGGPAQAWIHVDTHDALLAVLRCCRKERIPWRIHWPFSDWLVRDGGIKGVVIRPGSGFEGVRHDEEGSHIGAATPWAALGGPESPSARWPMARWPGSVGGLFDRGAQSVLEGRCIRLKWLAGRGVETIEVSPAAPLPEIPRTAVLLEMTLRPPLPRIVSSHRSPPSPGSVFFSPDGDDPHALVSRAQLRGTRLRSWRLSPVSPATLVQLGGGSCRDALLLARGIQTQVLKHRGVRLEVGIPVVGAEPGRRDP
ncbi:MAG: hypothetical protein QGG40_01650 [Myxococcota bacterium]|nr:hypothetical protein [Myxococcota bacterium]